MKAIKNEIIDELMQYEKLAKDKELSHEDLEMVKDLCETLYAVEEIKEIWESHYNESNEHHNKMNNSEYKETGNPKVY